MTSPTARTLNLLRKSGFIACPVERWIAQRGIRMDCFGFADLLAAHPRERRILLVQATTLSNVSARVKKIRSKPEASAWIASGGLIEVHGWALRSGCWHCKRISIGAEGLAAEVIFPMPRRTRGAAAWRPTELFDEGKKS